MNRIAVSRSAVLLAICLALPQPCPAQTETPEQVAGQIMAAMRAENWGRVASLMHPSALHQLRTMLDPLLESPDPAFVQARQLMFGLPTVEAAVAATDSAVFASLMQFSIAQQAGAADAMRSAEYLIIGTVPEGADTVHVVGRIAMVVEEVPTTMMEVISLQRTGNTWRGLLKGDLTAMASALRAAVERNQ